MSKKEKAADSHLQDKCMVTIFVAFICVTVEC